MRGVAMRLCGLGVRLDYLGVGTVVQLECSEGRSLVLDFDLFTSLLFLWQLVLILISRGFANSACRRSLA